MDSKSPPLGIGVLSVCTILLVLLLAVFSALTLSTAQADLALSQRGAQQVQAYYAGRLSPPPTPVATPLPVWDGKVPQS